MGHHLPRAHRSKAIRMTVMKMVKDVGAGVSVQIFHTPDRAWARISPMKIFFVKIINEKM